MLINAKKLKIQRNLMEQQQGFCTEELFIQSFLPIIWKSEQR